LFPVKLIDGTCCGEATAEIGDPTRKQSFYFVLSNSLAALVWLRRTASQRPAYETTVPGYQVP
jgi:hypothetical protein